MLEAFIAFREEVILRRTAFDLAEARERAHIVVGLVVAVANIDEVIALIRAAADPQAAKAGLMARPWPLADVLPLIRLVEASDENGEVAPTARSRPTGYRLSEEQAKAILEHPPAAADRARARQAHRRAARRSRPRSTSCC